MRGEEGWVFTGRWLAAGTSANISTVFCYSITTSSSVIINLHNRQRSHQYEHFRRHCDCLASLWTSLSRSRCLPIFHPSNLFPFLSLSLAAKNKTLMMIEYTHSRTHTHYMYLLLINQLVSGHTVAGLPCLCLGMQAGQCSLIHLFMLLPMHWLPHP